MKVYFISDFDVRPRKQVTVAFKKGWSGTIKRKWGEEAIANNCAVELKPGEQINGRADQPE